MGLQAGNLNKRITILSPVFSFSPSGQKVLDYTPCMQLWAQMRSVSNRTVSDDGAIVHDSEYRFYVRRRDGITDEMRIEWGQRTFELTGPPLDWQDDTRWMTLVAREVR